MTYDPVVGRWLEEDPIGFEGGDKNLYRYVKNDPTNVTDPSGLAARIGRIESAFPVDSSDIRVCIGSVINNPNFLPYDRGPEPPPNFVGEYNDLKRTGNFKHPFWVVWDGDNMGDIIIQRWVVKTVTWFGHDDNLPPGTRHGYVAGRRITPDMDNAQPDHPSGGNVMPLAPTNRIYVRDAPGFADLKKYLRANPQLGNNPFPIAYKANFYERAVSRTDGQTKGELWYDIVIEARGYGPENVMRNELLNWHEEIPRAFGPFEKQPQRGK